MIYITYKQSVFSESLSIKNVWSVNDSDVENKYIDFMLEKAKEINVVINPYWLNIMNYEDNNRHLSFQEYQYKSKQWKKIQKKWSIDKFISEVLKGKKENFEGIVKF